MTKQTIEVKGKAVQNGDVLFGAEVSKADGLLYKELVSVWIGGKHIWIDPDVTYTVEREVKPVHFKVGTVAKKGDKHLIRREHDWMHTGTGRTFWYAPVGDEYIFTGGWTIVYGGPEEEK